MTGQGEPPAEVAVGQPLEGFAEPHEEGEIEPGRVLGPLDQGKVEQNAELEQTKLDIRNFRRVVTGPKSTKAQIAAAEAQLGQLAAQEYARADGGRAPIKAALARAGFANPNKE